MGKSIENGGSYHSFLYVYQRVYYHRVVRYGTMITTVGSCYVASGGFPGRWQRTVGVQV